jgi:hypothetical protein
MSLSTIRRFLTRSLVAGAACSLAALASGVARAAPPAGTPSVKSEAEPAPSSPPVTLRVTPTEPTGPWHLSVGNTSEGPVQLRADVRLLSLELTPAISEPAKKRGPGRPLRCTLPEDTRPTPAQLGELVLDPSESWSTSFDPVFFCFGTETRGALVPGTEVRAFLGWMPPPVPARMRSKTPKTLSLEPPFILVPGAGQPSEFLSLKWIESATFVIPDEAPVRKAAEPAATDEEADSEPAHAAEADSANAAEDSEPPEEPPSTVSLSTPATLDLARGREVETTVTLHNDGEHPIAVWFRPDMIQVDVSSPSGTLVCATTEAARTPISELVIDVPSKGSTSTSVLLTALCPVGAFDAPGIYRIFPRLDTTKIPNGPTSLSLWRGVAKSKAPLLVRVRLPRQASVDPEQGSDD